MPHRSRTREAGNQWGGERCLGPNITLDWDGHSLIGSGSTGVEINASAAGGNVIRNGEITGRGTGVNMGPYSEVS